MFKEALVEVIERLNEAVTRGQLEAVGLVGGLAVSAWGVPRATANIDFAIVTADANAPLLAKSLGAKFHSPDAEDPLRGVIEGRIYKDSMRFQLILLPPRFQDLVSNNLEKVRLFETDIPIVSWKTLVLLKLYAGGIQDKLDASTILEVRKPGKKDCEDLRNMAKELNLSAAVDELLDTAP